MALKLTQQQLNDLFETAKSATPYKNDDAEVNMLDGECNEKRLAATRATRILRQYFVIHPDENIYGFPL